jgi:branched-chain amino acid transport system substrate-binding protein
MRGHLLRASGIAVLCASALAACGSNPATSVPIKHAKPRQPDSRTVHIYSSLPLYGPLRRQSLAIMRGIHLALHEESHLALNAQNHRVLNFSIVYNNHTDALNDATRVPPFWNQSLAERNARKAAKDPAAVFYVGDLDTPATQFSLPILNQAGIVQVTPGSAYAGLTDNYPGITQHNEPQKYYPIPSSRTLLRLIPSDVVEAAAGLEALKTYSGNCRDVAGAAFGPSGDAYTLLKFFQAQAKSYGFKFVVPTRKPGNTPASFYNYAEAIRHEGAGCFVLTGHVTAAAVALTREIHTVLPTAMILGTSGFCKPSWTAPRHDGGSGSIDTFLYCTSPVLPLKLYPGWQEFSREYRQIYKGKPSAYALYGYEAAEMAAKAIEALSPGEDERTVVRKQLLGGGPRVSSVFGPYSFNANGDTSSRTFGLYRASGPNGSPGFFHKVIPPHVLPPS